MSVSTPHVVARTRSRVIRAVVVALVGACGWLFLAPSQAGGLNTYVVTHGVSMQPSHQTGDLVGVRPTAEYRIGDLVAYTSADLQSVVLHRIVDRTANGNVLKGDNNDWLDAEKPTDQELLGKQVIHIPGGGTWLRRLTSPPALAAYAFLLLIFGGRTAGRTRRQRRKELADMSPRHSARPSAVTASLPDRLKPVAAGAALVGITGLALSGIAWTRPAQQAVQAGDSGESSMTFSYTAQVPASAAYDGTTVTAPRPIFRKLTDTVDVTYRYAGPAGQLRVRAELSTAGGWTSTVPLGKTVKVDKQFEGDVTLDLSSLERRAVEAAAVTGVPVGSLTVAVVPSVDMDAGGQFAPRLELALDPLVLKPLGKLVATETTSTTGSRDEPARLSGLGRSLDVSTARTLGAAMVLLFLLAAGLLAAAARLSSPVAEAERIRRRYSDLILTVMPVAFTPGRPVVDVPDVDSLVKLAERYGLLVLAWSRGEIDTYVVQDEGTTYRYRRAPPALHCRPRTRSRARRPAPPTKSILTAAAFLRDGRHLSMAPWRKLVLVDSCQWRPLPGPRRCGGHRR